MSKNHAVCGQAVQMRRLTEIGASVSRFLPTEIIRKHEHDIWFFRPCGSDV